MGKSGWSEKTNTKEECAIKVREEYPDATGVTWYEFPGIRGGYDGGCYPEFGNSLTTKTGGKGVFGCLFNGISYFIYMYVSQFYCFR